MSLSSTNNNSISLVMINLLKRYWALLLLLISIVGSAWFYLSSDYKLAQMLMSREWQSSTYSRIEPTQLDDLRMLRRVEQNSHMVYLPNHTYSRVTVMKLFSQDAEPISLHISETGKWNISGQYLITRPLEFKEITSGSNPDFNNQNLKVVKKIFQMDAEQSRKMEIINDKTILFTSLTYGSNIFYSL